MMVRTSALFAVAWILCGACSDAGAASDVTFSCSVEKDSETGWSIVRLDAVNASDPRKSITVRIAPEGGKNMFSLSGEG